MAEPCPYDAVVLAGGGARRLGGTDKPALEVGGRSLLDRVLTAVEAALRVVVVGPPRPVLREVLWAREDPPGGGPAAALGAGLQLVQADVVAVLAADLPFLTPAVVDRLRAEIGDGDGALLLDDTGREQWLISVWRTSALRAAITDDLHGARLVALLGGLRAVRLSLPPGPAAPWTDCDTQDDLRRARDDA